MQVIKDKTGTTVVTPEELNGSKIPGDWSVPPRSKVESVIYNHWNGCCKDKPILITSHLVPTWDGERWRSGPFKLRFNATCACGKWCTSGQLTPEEALDQYDRMTDRVAHDLPSEYDSGVWRGVLDMDVVRAEVITETKEVLR